MRLTHMSTRQQELNKIRPYCGHLFRAEQQKGLLLHLLLCLLLLDVFQILGIVPISCAYCNPACSYSCCCCRWCCCCCDRWWCYRFPCRCCCWLLIKPNEFAEGSKALCGALDGPPGTKGQKLLLRFCVLAVLATNHQVPPTIHLNLVLLLLLWLLPRWLVQMRRVAAAAAGKAGSSRCLIIGRLLQLP